MRDTLLVGDRLLPEILIFLFFMITDPKTTPAGRVARVVFGVAVAMVCTLLIAPQTTEFGAKVALLAGLVVMCVARLFTEKLLPAAGSDATGSAPSLPGWAEAARATSRPAARSRAGRSPVPRSYSWEPRS